MSDNQEEEGYGRYLVRGSSATFIGLILLAVGSMGLRVLLARGLSKDFYGLFFSVLALVSIIQTFSYPGFGASVTRFVSRLKAKEQRSKIKTFLFSAGIMLVVLTVLVIFALSISSGWLATHYFEAEAAAPVVIIMSIWVLMSNFTRFLSSTLQGFQNIVGRTAVRITRIWGTFLLIMVFLIIADLTVYSSAVLYLAGATFSSIVAFFLLKKKHFPKLTGEWTFSKPMVKKTMKYGLPLFLAGLGGTVISKTDTLMITGIRNLGDAGNYQVARPISRLIMYLGSAISVPLFPMISELWGKDEKDYLRTTLRKLLKFATVGIVPVTVIVLAFPEAIIRIVFGSKYLPAATTLRILAAAAVFWTFGGIFTSVLKGTDKTINVLAAMGGAALLNVPANFVLIPKYGATGAALATGASFVFMGLVSFYSIISEIKFKLPTFAVFKTLLGGGLILLLAYGLKSFLVLHFLLEIFLIVTASGFLYIYWILRTKTITQEDLELIEKDVPIPDKISSLLHNWARE